MEYMIIRADDLRVLVENVKLAISQGWELAQSPTIPAGDASFYQAMTRKTQVING